MIPTQIDGLELVTVRRFSTTVKRRCPSASVSSLCGFISVTLLNAGGGSGAARLLDNGSVGGFFGKRVRCGFTKMGVSPPKQHGWMIRVFSKPLFIQQNTATKRYTNVYGNIRQGSGLFSLPPATAALRLDLV